MQSAKLHVCQGRCSSRSAPPAAAPPVPPTATPAVPCRQACAAAAECRAACRRERTLARCEGRPAVSPCVTCSRPCPVDYDAARDALPLSEANLEAAHPKIFPPGDVADWSQGRIGP